MPAATALAPLLTLALWAAAAPSAHAQAHWVCRLTDDAVRLACVAESDPLQPTAQAPAVTARVLGTAFPLDGARMYLVDLWSPPTDLAFVEQLARATICYRSPGCTVVLAEGAMPTARVRAAR